MPDLSVQRIFSIKTGGLTILIFSWSEEKKIPSQENSLSTGLGGFQREDEFAQHAETFRRRHDREATISYSEAKTYASLVLVLGGAVVLGDPFGYLNSQGKDLLYKVLQAELAPGCPLNLFEEGLAKVWHQPLKAGMRVALFNWEDEPQAIRLDYNALNLHPGQQAVDFWTGEKVQLPEDSVFLLKPRSALVLEFDKP